MLFVRCRHIRHVDELVTCDGVLFVVVTMMMMIIMFQRRKKGKRIALFEVRLHDLLKVLKRITALKCVGRNTTTKLYGCTVNES